MSDEESKAQKAKASSVIEKSKTEAPPRDAEGKLRIMTPMVSYEQPEDMEQSPGTQATHEQAEGDLKTAHQTPTIPAAIVELHPDAGAASKPELVSNLVESTNALSHESPPLSSISPVLMMSPPPTEATPVSGDVLLPMIIFSVVKTNPPQLVSNLLYTQRFRNQSVGGEESYCLINLMAVAEFLENVDLAALGLGDSDKVMRSAFIHMFVRVVVLTGRLCAVRLT